METCILASMESKSQRRCQIHKLTADFYCVRCNWRGDEPEKPREGEKWHACPVCRGHALPWERRRRR